MKKLLFLFALTFIFVFAVSAGTAFKHIPYKSASWDVETVVEGSQKMEINQKIYYKNEKMRIEGAIINPSTGEMQEQVIIVTNDATMMYFPESKSGFKYSNDSDANPQKLSNVQAEYRDRAKKTGYEKVNGVMCDIWQYTIDEEGDGIKVKEWRGKDGFVYRSVSEDLKGDKTKTTTDVISLKKDIKLADSLFKIPGDVQVMDFGNMLKGFQGQSENEESEEAGSEESVKKNREDSGKKAADALGESIKEEAAKEAVDMLKGMFGQ